MKQKLNRGFTLIELLVVIAIIGILASVVLASLNTARDKGTDAAVKSNLNNMRAQAELYYDDNSRTYGTEVSDCASGMFSSGTIANALANITSTKICDTSDSTTATAAASSWMMAGELTDGTYYCVDSGGNATTTTSAPAAVAEATASPASCG